MIVPLTYFIEKPFQNWTYESAEQIGAVVLRVDYTVPVERLRQKLDEVLRQSKLWDGKLANLQVTDHAEGRSNCARWSAPATRVETWDLRCEVREKLIAFFQAEASADAMRSRPDEITEPPDAAAEPSAGKAQLALADRRT